MSEAIANPSELAFHSQASDAARNGWRSILDRPWLPLLIAVIGTFFVEWYSAEHVYTRELLSHILGAGANSAPARAVMEQLQGAGTARLFGTPLVLAVRIGIMALLLQLVMLAFRLEVPISVAFKAAAWASIAMLAKSVARLVLLASDTSHVTAESLLTTPWSLGSTFHLGLRHGVAVRDLADSLNPFELLWVVVVYVVLTRAGASRWRAASGVAVLWCSLALLRFGFAAYIAGVHL